MAYKIEKNIPIPRDTSLFPFEEMGPGDSFVVPVGGYKNMMSLRSALSNRIKSVNLKNKSTLKIKTRREKGCLRVWIRNDSSKKSKKQ